MHHPTTPRQRPGTTLDKRDSSATLVADDGTELATLDPAAAALWELCDGQTTPAEIVDAICEVWAVDADTARRDVEATLAELAAAGLIDWQRDDDG